MDYEGEFCCSSTVSDDDPHITEDFCLLSLDPSDDESEEYSSGTSFGSGNGDADEGGIPDDGVDESDEGDDEGNEGDDEGDGDMDVEGTTELDDLSDTGDNFNQGMQAKSFEDDGIDGDVYKFFGPNHMTEEPRAMLITDPVQQEALDYLSCSFHSLQDQEDQSVNMENLKLTALQKDI